MWSRCWRAPIGFSVSGVILQALLIGALGVGGLDDFAGITLRPLGGVGPLDAKTGLPDSGALGQRSG